MKATELMVGDIVRVGKDVCIKKGVIVKVRGIDGDNVFPEKGLKGSAACESISNRMDSGGIWLEYLEPIRITENMLIRWGFRFDGMNAYILEQRRGVHDPKDKQSYYIKVIPPQPDNDDWWSPEDTGFEVNGNKGDLLLTDQGDTYYHILQHLLIQAGLEDIVKLNL